jgi:type II secretory pathway pseudopilin PulG
MIELLFVIVVIGVMLAVVTPRAYRANIDAKYGVVRQGAVELTSYALDWANQSLASQDQEQSLASLDRYMASLSGQDATVGLSFPDAEWIAGGAVGNTSNWNNLNLPRPILGRVNSLGANIPENAVQDLLSSNKIPVNPFNGVSVFQSSNDPANTLNPVTGAIACAGVDEGAGSHYYALVFQGTDSTTGADENPSNDGTTAFYAGQDAGNLQGLRNGIFLARER